LVEALVDGGLPTGGTDGSETQDTGSHRNHQSTLVGAVRRRVEGLVEARDGEGLPTGGTNDGKTQDSSGPHTEPHQEVAPPGFFGSSKRYPHTMQTVP
jgi:hypothetical protein